MKLLYKDAYLLLADLKEKLLAAKQHDIKKVIVPQENYDDIQEISKEIDLKDLNIVYATTMDDVLDAAFAKSPLNASKAKNKKKSSKKN